MTPDLARAIRRAVLAGFGLAATMLAHQAAMDHRVLGPRALFALVLVVSAAVVAGHRRGGFRPRGPLAGAVAVVAAPAGGHAAMGVAPWAFGMHAAPAAALLTPRALLAHVVAAVVVWLLLLDLERVMAAAIAAVRAVRRAMRRPLRGAPAAAPLASAVRRPGARVVLGLAPSRGPPSPSIA